jgi:hypothetical protein
VIRFGLLEADAVVLNGDLAVRAMRPLAARVVPVLSTRTTG